MGEVPGDRAGLLLAADALYGLAAWAVRWHPREISLTAVSTMATLARTGPRRITDLAVSEGVTQPSMTALVGTLVRSGLAERRADPRDQRVVLVALSDAGSEHLRAHRQAATDQFATAIGKLAPEETDALLAAAPAFRHLLELAVGRGNARS